MHLIDRTGCDWLKPEQLDWLKPEQIMFFNALKAWPGVPNPLAGESFAGKREPDYIVPTLILRRDQRMLLSAEDGTGLLDYYGEMNSGYSFIHPDIQALAKRCDVFLEWENPGAVCVWPV